MKSTLFLLLTALMLTVSCANDPNDAQKIEIELLEGSTELPAKVTLFFKVDVQTDEILTTLEPGNFEIYENGSFISSLESKAQIQRESGDFVFSTVLLLDLSGSIINNDDLPDVKQAATTFINSTLPGETSSEYGSREMALYWFDGEQEIHQLVFFTPDRDSLIQAVNRIDSNISTDNSTNLNGAVVQGIDLVTSRLEENRRDLDISTAGSVVLFTDGTDQAARVSTADALNAVKNSGSDTSIFTIGLGGEIDQEILAQFGEDGFVYAENSSELNDSFQNAADILESQTNSFYVLEYCSPKRSGQHNLEIRAVYEDKVGSFRTVFDATGFTGGCVVN